MAGRVPILSSHGQGEAREQPVDYRNDRIPVFNGQASARAEVVLHINHDQRPVFHDQALGFTAPLSSFPGRKRTVREALT